MPLKTCPQCNIAQELSNFSQRKTPRTKDKRIEYYSTCKPCMRVRYRKWMFKNANKVLAYERLRSTYRRRKTPVCAYCGLKGELVWQKFGKQMGKYHKDCITQKYYAIGDIPPERKKQLQQISASGGIFERTF